MTIHTIHDAFCERVKAAPDRTLAERPGQASLSFAEGLAGVGSLAAALVAGREVNGAKSWLYIGPVGLQVAEIAKVGTVLAVTALLARSLGINLL